MAASRVLAATVILAASVTAGCTGSGHGGASPTGGSGSGTSGPTPCSEAVAKRAATVVISDKAIKPTCVTLARGHGLSIVNEKTAPVHGTLRAPSNKLTTVDLPHRNSVLPFRTKKAGRYVFSCTGCDDKLEILVH